MYENTQNSQPDEADEKTSNPSVEGTDEIMNMQPPIEGTAGPSEKRIKDKVLNNSYLLQQSLVSFWRGRNEEDRYKLSWNKAYQVYKMEQGEACASFTDFCKLSKEVNRAKEQILEVQGASEPQGNRWWVIGLGDRREHRLKISYIHYPQTRFILFRDNKRQDDESQKLPGAHE